MNKTLVPEFRIKLIEMVTKINSIKQYNKKMLSRDEQLKNNWAY